RSPTSTAICGACRAKGLIRIAPCICLGEAGARRNEFLIFFPLGELIAGQLRGQLAFFSCELPRFNNGLATLFVSRRLHQNLVLAIARRFLCYNVLRLLRDASMGTLTI